MRVGPRERARARTQEGGRERENTDGAPSSGPLDSNIYRIIRTGDFLSSGKNLTLAYIRTVNMNTIQHHHITHVKYQKGGMVESLA